MPRAMGTHAIARACFERQVGGASTGSNSSTPACQPRFQSTSRGESAGDVALAVHADRHADSLTAWIIGHHGRWSWAEMGSQADTLAAHNDLRGEHLELLEGQASFERWPTRGAGMPAGDVGYQLGWWLLWARPAVDSSRHGLHRVGLRLLLRRIAPPR
jgi:hypothetical protein